jgi:DNA-binding CsgD family transcriptional regulator
MEAGERPSQELVQKMGQFVGRHLKSGVFVDGAGLHRSAARARVSFGANGEALVERGPFDGQNELLARFALITTPNIEQAIELATDEGDEDLASTAASHLASGLGFVGDLRQSIERARAWSTRSRAAGLDTWTVHFDAVDLYDSVLMAVDPATTAARAREFLAENPVFRNRFMIELALTLSLADAGDADAAGRAADVAAASASSVEAKVFALLARSELAWCANDVDAVVDHALALREHGDAWFGIRSVAEAGAAHLSAEHGRPFEPAPTTTLLPILWPALDELDGWRAHAAGDLGGALASFRSGAAGWARHDMPRFAVRAFHAAWLVGRDAVDLDAAVSTAREHRLVGHLRRLGHGGRGSLTPREIEVLRLVAKGLTSTAIARELGIGAATVDDHVKRARAKLGASSRVEAARLIAGS